MAPVATIEDLTEKIIANPEAAVDDAQLEQLEEGVNTNLAKIEKRKNELLKRVSDMIVAAEKERGDVDPAKNPAEAKKLQDRLRVLSNIKRKLEAEGARISYGELKLNEVPGVLKDTAVAVGIEAKNRAEMTLQNVGLIMQKHPLLATFTGLGLAAGIYKMCTPSEGQPLPWWKKLLTGALTIGLTAVGVNFAAQHFYPDEATRLNKAPTA